MSKQRNHKLNPKLFYFLVLGRCQRDAAIDALKKIISTQIYIEKTNKFNYV
jgi:hypothetical protein